MVRRHLTSPPSSTARSCASPAIPTFRIPWKSRTSSRTCAGHHDALRRAAARRRRRHASFHVAHRRALRRRTSPARRRRHEDQPPGPAGSRGAPGRKRPQDASGHGQRRSRRGGEACRPPAQHAHAGISCRRKAAAHRPRNARYLRAHRAPPGHGLDPRRTRRSGVQLSRARGLPAAAERRSSPKRKEFETFLTELQDTIRKRLERWNSRRSAMAASKRLYSIHQKIMRQHRTLDQIYDLLAVRIITDTIRNCYAALGVIHQVWRPVPGRFKDYIAMPRPNLYQSLHTTVIHAGQTFEVQIRTQEMHRIAEAGRRRALEIQGRQGRFRRRRSAHCVDAPVDRMGRGDARAFANSCPRSRWTCIPRKFTPSRPREKCSRCRAAPLPWILHTPCTPKSAINASAQK